MNMRIKHMMSYWWVLWSMLALCYCGAPSTISEVLNHTLINDTTTYGHLKALLVAKLSISDEPETSLKTENGFPDWVLAAVPDELVRRFWNLSRPVLEGILLKNMSTIPSRTLLQLPTSVLLLLPNETLSTLPGLTMAALALKDVADSSVASRLCASVGSDEQMEEFLTGLKQSGLVLNAAKSLTKAVIKRWPEVETQWNDEMFLLFGSGVDPVLANLPAEFLNNLSMEQSLRFVSALQHAVSFSTFRATIWNYKPTVQKRLWMETIQRVVQWTPHLVNSLPGLIITSIIPKEIENLPRPVARFMAMKSRELNLSPLKTNYLFDAVYGTTNLSLNESDFNLFGVLASSLSPSRLQRFNVITTPFSQMRVAVEMATSDSDIQLSSALQITEYLIAQSTIQSGNPKSWHPSKWQSQTLMDIGNFAYTLPPSLLKSLKFDLLKRNNLESIMSALLSPLQCRIIGKATTVKLLKTPNFLNQFSPLIRALPASTIVAQVPASKRLSLVAQSGTLTLGQAVAGRSALLMDKNAVKIALTFSENPNQLFSLLSPREFLNLTSEVVKMFTLKAGENKTVKDPQVVKQLPRTLLSSWLAEVRMATDLKTLTFDLLTDKISKANSILGMSLLGLTCNDVEILDFMDLFKVLGRYNLEREISKANGRYVEFSRDLQKCMLKKVEMFLQHRTALQEAVELMKLTSENSSLLSVLDNLVLGEIDAIGGYVLSSLPANLTSRGAMVSKEILKTIANMPLSEIIKATGNFSEVVEKANQLFDLVWKVNEHDVAKIEQLGSFVSLLPASKLSTLSKRGVELYLTTAKPSSKMFCGTAEQRFTWKQYLFAVFGNLSFWEPEVVSVVGDLLIVLTPSELAEIKRNSWTAALETLVQETSYFKRDFATTMNVKELNFVEVCSNYLPPEESKEYVESYIGLMRWYVKVSTSVESEIKHAGSLVKSAGPQTIKPSVTPPVATTEASQTSTKHNVPQSDQPQTPKTPMVESTVAAPLLTNTFVNHNGKFEESSSKNGSRSRRDTIQNLMNYWRRSYRHYRETGEHANKFTEAEQLLNNVDRKIELLNNVAGNQRRNYVLERSDSEGFQRDSSQLGERRNMTCLSIRTAKHAAHDGISKADLDLLHPTELADCLETFGMINLQTELKEHIWSILNKTNSTLEHLDRLDSLLSEIPLLSLQNMNISLPEDLDTICELGKYVQDEDKINILADKISKLLSPISKVFPELAICLGNIACGLDSISLKNIFGGDGTIFLSASPVLGKMEKCSNNALKELATMAMKPNAYGNPANWTAEDLTTLGIIVTGLSDENLKLITKKNPGQNPLLGLQSSAVLTMTPSQLMAFDVAQLLNFSPSMAVMITEDQKSLMSGEQKDSIENAAGNFVCGPHCFVPEQLKADRPKSPLIEVESVPQEVADYSEDATLGEAGTGSKAVTAIISWLAVSCALFAMYGI